MLISVQSHQDLKIVPYLELVHVNPNPRQYKKMQVGGLDLARAAQVVSHSTAMALKFCVNHKLIYFEALTTARFSKPLTLV